jgi:ABC-type sulfate transport system permease component
MASVSQAIGGFFTLPHFFVAISMLHSSQAIGDFFYSATHPFDIARRYTSLLLAMNFVPIATNVRGKKLNIFFGIPSF